MRQTWQWLTKKNVSAIFEKTTPEAVAQYRKQFLVALNGFGADALSLKKIRYKTYIKSAFNRTSNLTHLSPKETFTDQYFISSSPASGGKGQTVALKQILTSLPPASETILSEIMKIYNGFLAKLPVQERRQAMCINGHSLLSSIKNL